MKTNFYLFLVLLVFFTGALHAQKGDDNLIVVTVSDTTKLYERVRHAITYTNLIIRADSKKDTLITKSEIIDGTTIFLVAKIILKNNKVEISGAFGLGIEDFWGYPSWPKSYKRVVYFKGSQGWKVIRQIAIKLDGEIQYQNEK